MFNILFIHYFIDLHLVNLEIIVRSDDYKEVLLIVFMLVKLNQFLCNIGHLVIELVFDSRIPKYLDLAISYFLEVL